MNTAAPPNDQATERALLGLAMLHNDAIDPAAAALDPGDYYHPRHAAIWSAVVALRSKAEPVDALTVADQLRNTGDHRGNDTLVELLALIDDAGYHHNLRRYVDTLTSLSTRRAAIAFGHNLVARASDQGDTGELTEWATDQLTAITRRRGAEKGPVLIGDALAGWMAREEAHEAAGPDDKIAAGIATGIADLDARLLGFRPGQLIVIGARPAMGKSAAALQFGVTAAENGHATLLVSLEMGVEEIVERVIGAHAAVDLTRIRSHNLHFDDWPRVEGSIAKLNATPLHVLDDGASTVESIRGWAKQVPAVELVIVDYLQLVTHRGRSENRQTEVADIARGLKRMARELDVAVVALAQINRGVEMRADKRPTLADLRDSGEIEAAADVVMGLYREDYYDDETPDRGVAELIVLKQRNGPTGTVKVAWLEHHGRFALLGKRQLSCTYVILTR